MQDRFKFRVWSYEQKKMYNWSDCIKITNFIYGMFVDNRMLGRGSWNIEQCTGLKDKNGKLVYEGDIVERYVGLGKRGSQKTKDIDVVKWKINGYALENYCDYFVDTDDFEVIGNIHENPGLLED